VWSRDSANPGGFPNTIWSVALDASGDPVPGSKTLEITLDQPGVFPAPIADLAFNDECCLYAAQRTMKDMETDFHQADMLKFCWERTASGGQWIQSGSFVIGDPTFGLNHSSVGGVSVDNTPGGFVWTSGDALLLPAAPITYGAQGTPQTGGSIANSVVVDFNGFHFGSTDKGLVGSCEVACRIAPSCDVEVEDVRCLLGPDGYPTGQYSAVVTITNNSGQTVNLILVPTLGYFQYIDPPLQNGSSITIKLVVSGQPGTVISVPMGLYDGTVNCCGVKAEFELPECKCALFTEVHVECISDGNPNTYQYSVSFVVNNISQNPAFTATWLFFIPPANAGYSFAPTVVNVFPLTSPGSTFVGPVTLNFSAPPPPNWTLDVPVSIHNANLALCCDAILHLEAPPPCPPSCSPDLNNDGVVNGADLALLLGQWGPSTGTCADLNFDGAVNGADLAILLGAWS